MAQVLALIERKENRKVSRLALFECLIAASGHMDMFNTCCCFGLSLKVSPLFVNLKTGALETTSLWPWFFFVSLSVSLLVTVKSNQLWKKHKEHCNKPLELEVKHFDSGPSLQIFSTIGKWSASHSFVVLQLFSAPLNRCQNNAQWMVLVQLLKDCLPLCHKNMLSYYKTTVCAIVDFFSILSITTEFLKQATLPESHL